MNTQKYKCAVLALITLCIIAFGSYSLSELYVRKLLSAVEQGVDEGVKQALDQWKHDLTNGVSSVPPAEPKEDRTKIRPPNYIERRSDGKYRYVALDEYGHPWPSWVECDTKEEAIAAFWIRDDDYKASLTNKWERLSE